MPGRSLGTSPTLDFRTGGSTPSYDRELTLNSLKGGAGAYRLSNGAQGESGGSPRGSRLLDPPTLRSSAAADKRYAAGSTESSYSGRLSGDRYSPNETGSGGRFGGGTTASDTRLGNSSGGGTESVFGSKYGLSDTRLGEGRFGGAGGKGGASDSRLIGGSSKLYGTSEGDRIGGRSEPRANPFLDTSSTSSSHRYNGSSGTLGGRDTSPLDRGESRQNSRPAQLKRGGTSTGARERRETDDQGEEEDSKRIKDLSKPGKKKKKRHVNVNLGGTRYDIVRQVCESLGFTQGKDEDPLCYLIWNDAFVSTERISELKPYQRINHFPGMGEICRKDSLARNMAKMTKLYPDDFNFVPKTWIFPQEYSAFQSYARELKKKKKTKTFIVKPSNGAMGNGIQLYRNAEKIPNTEHMIVQEYMDKPLLVEGYKVDLRIYVLVTSVDPLRVFLYHDGLLRMSTEKYVHPTDGNIDHLYMHLTNYSVNKHSDEYVKSNNTETGSKRSLSFLNDYLRKHSDQDVGYLWRNISEMIVKTMLVAHPHVLHAYRMCRPGQPPAADSVCFEVLGFDVMLDRKLRPWLLEINRSPSFGTDEKLDKDIKFGVVLDTVKLLNIKTSDKRKNIAAQKAEAQRRLLRPNKRLDGETTEQEKKRLSVERKKDDLRDLLARMRKDSHREDFENRNSGRFKRIFPPEDKFTREKYATLLADCFSIFMSGRASSLTKEIERTYNYKLKEEDVLDMLAQYEADEKDTKAGGIKQRGPKSLPLMSESKSSVQSSSNKAASSSPPSTSYEPLSGKERDEELTKRTHLALNDMRIKFPGKSDDEAEFILDKLHENWKFHKPRIASYWLVKLDSIKRRKVIDIVRSNVRAVLQRTWKNSDVESVRLYRIFTRVFNRLLWSHGQGLWNCFQPQGNSWETIFSKSSDTVSEVELACCRRVVQLCRDCLLIVYQFAAEAKASQGDSTAAATSSATEPQQFGTGVAVGSGGSTLTAPATQMGRRTPGASGSNDNKTWTTPQTLSQRMSRLYSGRTAASTGQT